MSTLFDELENPRYPSAPLSLSHSVSGETEAVPLNLSHTPDDVDLASFFKGMELLGMAPKPQQVEFARVLEALGPNGLALYPHVAACIVRRASKTTTAWAVALGRCALRPGYQVVTSAQTGVKARERFMTVQRVLAPKNVGGYVIKKGAGAEAIEWTNGSRLWVVPPEGGAFRGDAADMILLDEAQEHTPEATADILGGALALMDTKPGGQIVVLGTAGKHRAGMLWDYLERGRRGEIGIVEYAIPDGDAVILYGDDGEPMRDEHGRYVPNVPAILAAHPGIGTLTTLDVVLDRFYGLPLAQFAREYGGLWPEDTHSRAIDPKLWAAGSRPRPEKPARYALAFDVAPDQSAAALVAAWRDEDGKPWWEVVHHDAGDGWLAKAVWEHTKAHRTVPVGYDSIGPNQSVADRLVREARPRPKLYTLGTRDILAAASTALREIRAGDLRHVDDPALDRAAEEATRRGVGDGSFAWGRLRSGSDISALVAATNALKVFDTYVRTSTSTAGRTRMRAPSST